MNFRNSYLYFGINFLLKIVLIFSQPSSSFPVDGYPIPPTQVSHPRRMLVDIHPAARTNSAFIWYAGCGLSWHSRRSPRGRYSFNSPPRICLCLPQGAGRGFIIHPLVRDVLFPRLKFAVSRLLFSVTKTVPWLYREIKCSLFSLK